MMLFQFLRGAVFTAFLMMNASPLVVQAKQGDVFVFTPGQPIVIAVLDMPRFGFEMKNPVDLAVAQFGGSILGHPVHARHFRFGCDATPAQIDNFLRNIILEPKVVGVIGPICSSAAFRKVPFLSDAKILTISPANTAPGLTAEDFHASYPYYFRTASSDIYQGDVGGRFAVASTEDHGLGAGTAAIVGIDDAYSHTLSGTFKGGFVPGVVAGEFIVDIGQEDFSVVLDQIASLDADPNEPGIQNVDVIYAPLFGELVPFFSQLREMNHPLSATPVLATDGSFGGFLFDIFGPNPAELYGSMMIEFGPKFPEFLEDYLAAYGHDPGPFQTLAYDATMLMLNALADKAQSTAKGGMAIDPADLLDYMNDPANYPYLGAGATYFKPVFGDLNPNGWGVFKAENGELTPVFP